MRNWKKHLDDEYNLIYKSKGSDSNDEITIAIDRQLKTISFYSRYFVIKEDCTWEAQQAEKDEWLKHSCKYGHWQAETTLTLDKEDLEFALKLYKENIGE